MKPAVSALATHPFLRDALGASADQPDKGTVAIEAAAFKMNSHDGRTLHRAAIAGIAIFAAEAALAEAAPAGKRATVTDLNLSFVQDAVGQVNATADVGALNWASDKKQGGQVLVTDTVGTIFAIMDFEVRVTQIE